MCACGRACVCVVVHVRAVVHVRVVVHVVVHVAVHVVVHVAVHVVVHVAVHVVVHVRVRPWDTAKKKRPYLRFVFQPRSQCPPLPSRRTSVNISVFALVCK